MDHAVNFSEIISNSQGIASFGLVLLASLIGSLHCAGMCGPLSVCASQKSPLRSLLYHVGRLLGYLAVGLLFGFLGKGLLEGSFQYVNLMSTVLVSGIFFIFAYQLIFKSGLKAKLPESVNQTIQKSLWFTKGKPNLFSLSLGVLTPLLPCGWFYGFALVAMTSASPVKGAMLMTCFWLGTIPALVVVTEATRFGLNRIQPKLKAVAGVMFFCLGILILSNKYQHLSHMGHSSHEHQMNSAPKDTTNKHNHHHHH